MIKTIIIPGIAATTLIASVVFILAAPSTEVKASTPAAKGDRLNIRPVGPACSQRAWPYYESNCIRDYTKPVGHANKVRLVSTDRLPNAAAQIAK